MTLSRLANVLPAHQHGPYGLESSRPGGPIGHDRMMGRSADTLAKGSASRRDACSPQTVDERAIVEWVIWNVRVCDLPDDVREATARTGRTGRYPRPDRVGRYGPLTVHVSAFPQDETLPVVDRWCSRPGAGEAVRDLLTDDVGYVLIHQERPPNSNHDGQPGP